MIPAEFDEIRPYTPEELPQVFEELIADPEFQGAMGHAFKGMPFENIAAAMRASKSNLEFQKALVYPFIKGVIAKLSSGLTISYENRENMSKSLCISNHRDIIMDAYERYPRFPCHHPYKWCIGTARSYHGGSSQSGSLLQQGKKQQHGSRRLYPAQKCEETQRRKTGYGYLSDKQDHLYPPR